jgi:WD40 repeat protein
MMKKNSFCLGGIASIGFVLAVVSVSSPKEDSTPTIYCTLGKAENIYALEFSPDGKRLLTGVEQPNLAGKDTNDRIVEWNVESKSTIRGFDPGHYGQTTTIRYSQSGRFFVIGHLDGFVSVRDRKGDAVLSFKSVENLLSGTLCLATISESTQPQVHTIIGSKLAQTRSIGTGDTRVYLIPCEGNYFITSAAAARYGTTFVCCSTRFLSIYRKGDFDFPVEIKSFHTFKEPTITQVAMSDDGTLVLAYESGGELALFDVKNDKLIRKWKAHGDAAVYSIIPFHGINWFATGNEAGDIRIWNEKAESLALLQVKGNRRPVAALALARDNSLLASSGERREIVIWDIRPLLRSAAPKKKDR